LDVLVLLEIIDRPLENWIQEQLNASSLVTLQDKEVTNVGVPLNGEHLLAWTLLFERLSLSMERKPISVHYLKILTLQNP
jgi:hypothetical protein